MNSLYLLVYMVGSVISYGKDKNSQDYDVGTREKNFEELYKEGRQHYLDNNFQDCVKYIEAALSDYKDYTSLINHCKSDCKKQKNTDYVVKTIKEYLHYEGLVRETLCLMKCKRGKLHPNRKEEIEDPDLVQDFQSRKTYDYLQLCYFQTKNNQSAANAAYTNIMFNQEHEIMKENLNYYLDLPGVNSSNLVNLEEQEFVAPYLAGRAYYTEKNWSKLVESMELAVKLYLQEEEMCRMECEKPFNMGWFPDFVSSVSNHFTFCTKCKLNCATQLHRINGGMEEDLLPLFYHYLQFAYFKVEDYSNAADCAVTYLEFRPDNVDMQNNINYYRAIGNVQGKVRTEARNYIDREEDELAILDFIEEMFVFEDEIMKDEKPQESATKLAKGMNSKGGVVEVDGSVVEVEGGVVDPQKDKVSAEKILTPPPLTKYEL